MRARLERGKYGVSKTEYTGKHEIMGMTGKRQEILMTAILVYGDKNMWYEEGYISFHK